MSTRRTFTREFKVEAVALVSRQGLSVAEAGRRLEIGQNLLRKWREQLAAEGRGRLRRSLRRRRWKKRIVVCGLRTIDCRWSVRS